MSSLGSGRSLRKGRKVWWKLMLLLSLLWMLVQFDTLPTVGSHESEAWLERLNSPSCRPQLPSLLLAPVLTETSVFVTFLTINFATVVAKHYRLL